DTVKNSSGTAIWSASYGYDANSNLTSKVIGPAGVAGAGTNTYGYDEANRLTSWAPPSPAAAVSYSYDDADNRLTSGSTTASYDQRNRVLTSAQGGTTTNYTWAARGTMASTKVGTNATTTTQADAFGRTTTDGASTYTYDSLDRIRTKGSATLSWSGMTQQL